jgi:hypothetical protein
MRSCDPARLEANLPRRNERSLMEWLRKATGGDLRAGLGVTRRVNGMLPNIAVRFLSRPEAAASLRFAGASSSYLTDDNGTGRIRLA